MLLLPAINDTRAVRSALMAMKVTPMDLTANADGMHQLQSSLQVMPYSMALIDLGAMQPAMPTILALTKFMEDPALRRRVVLTRGSVGPVWAADRAWAKRLGFCDLYPEIDRKSVV